MDLGNSFRICSPSARGHWVWISVPTAEVGHPAPDRWADVSVSYVTQAVRLHNTTRTTQTTPTGMHVHTSAGHSTFKFDGEARQAHGGVAPERQEEAVAAALDPVGGLGALEAADQRAVGVGALVHVQEVIAGLHVEAAKTGRSGTGQPPPFRPRTAVPARRGRACFGVTFKS